MGKPAGLPACPRALLLQFRTVGVTYPKNNLDACGFATQDWYNEATVSRGCSTCLPGFPGGAVLLPAAAGEALGQPQHWRRTI